MHQCPPDVARCARDWQKKNDPCDQQRWGAVHWRDAAREYHQAGDELVVVERDCHLEAAE